MTMTLEEAREEARKMTMTLEEAREEARKMTMEDLWTGFARIEAMQEETSAKLAEAAAEIKLLSRNIGGVNNTLGRWVEEMIYPGLWRKFEAFGYEFTQGCKCKKFTENGQDVAEADIFLENGDFVMPVEIKTTLDVEDVDEHLERMEKIRRYMDKKGDKRFIVGAVAGAIVPENVCRYAQKKGLYVVVRSGDDVKIASVPNSFVPRKL